MRRNVGARSPRPYLLILGVGMMVWWGLGMMGCGGKEDGIVAKVGDQPITVEDFQRAVKRLRLFYRDQTPREMLQPLIDRKIMALEAEKRGLGEDPRVIAALESARIRRLTEKAYKEEVTKKVAISEEEIRAYFEEHGLDKKREVRASHIMVGTLEEAQTLRRRLMEGADFAGLAQEVSLDTTTAAKGGDMGYWQEESIRKSPFVRQLFGLKVGEVSEPYQDARGHYHLIKATEEQPVGLDRQKRQIQRILERQKKDERWRAYLDEQEARFHLTMDEETLSFLLKQGRRAVDGVPTTPPEEQGRVLLRYNGGEVELGTYVDMVKNTRLSSRPTSVDSAAVVQFARDKAMTAVLLPRVAQEQGWIEAEEVRSTLKKKREEAMIKMLRRSEVEDRILTDEALRAYYESHREDFVESARTFVEGGIAGTKEEAREIAARVRGDEELAEVMRAYPMFLGRWRKYDVFQFSSSEPSHREGGVGEMIEAARGLRAGEVRGPVPIAFERDEVGYVVLRVLEIRPARPLPFDDPRVQQTVRGKVHHERRQEIEAAFERYMDDLRKRTDAQVVVYEHVLKSVASEWVR